MTVRAKLSNHWSSLEDEGKKYTGDLPADSNF
jgi:hypothetical protein